MVLAKAQGEMIMEQLKCLNTKPCTCKNTSCPRHGRCCECVAFHRDEKKGYPNCIRYVLEEESSAVEQK